MSNPLTRLFWRIFGWRYIEVDCCYTSRRDDLTVYCWYRGVTKDRAMKEITRLAESAKNLDFLILTLDIHETDD